MSEPNTIVVDKEEWLYMHQSLLDAYHMLRESLDNNLLLANKLTNAQARWLGRTDGN